MRKVEIKNNEIRLGSRKITLISGEVHYWRLNPNYWKQVLERVRALGLEMVSTYIPWNFHEYKKGSFDFTGLSDPARNLKRFLDLTQSEKFWLLIRPGPYIYSEWPNEGVPDYAYKYHRLHPEFLGAAQNYMAEVCKVLKPYFANRPKGHILLLQADNEIDPWPDLFGAQYGLGGKPGLFQDFLKRHYHRKLSSLNKAWGTSYQSFDQAGAFLAVMLKDGEGLPLKGDRELQRHLDYLKFKYDYSRQYADWTVRTYRKLGVKIPIYPIYLNLYPFFYAHDWIPMQEVSDLVGVDFYPTSELKEDRFEHRKFMDKIRYLKNVSRLPFIAEFAAGIWHARHYETGVLTANHYRLLALSALAAGIAGWNWYMLVNRDNWYMSPINEWGRERAELYEVFKEIVTVFKRLNPATLKKVTDVAVTYNPLQYAARTLKHNCPVLSALYDSDVDYEVYDPRLKRCDKKILFYSGNQWLEKSAHVNLRNYVRQGGILVVFQSYPRKDAHFEPYSVLGFEEPLQILFEFKRKINLQLGPNRPVISLESAVYIFDPARAQKITSDLGPYSRCTIGYIKKLGKGHILHLGVKPTRTLVIEVLNYFRVARPGYSSTPDIHTAIFKRSQSYYLVVTNNGMEDKSASVHLPMLQRHRTLQVRNLMNDVCEKYSSARHKTFTISIPRKDGKVFEIKP